MPRARKIARNSRSCVFARARVNGPHECYRPHSRALRIRIRNCMLAASTRNARTSKRAHFLSPLSFPARQPPLVSPSPAPHLRRSCATRSTALRTPALFVSTIRPSASTLWPQSDFPRTECYISVLLVLSPVQLAADSAATRPFKSSVWRIFREAIVHTREITDISGVRT